MVVSLNKNYFLIYFFLVSLIFVPLLILGSLCIVFEGFGLVLLITIVVLTIAYTVSSICIYRVSKKKNDRIEAKESGKIVIHKNDAFKDGCLELDTSNIIKIDYYRITSICAWLCLFSGTGTAFSTDITYLNDGCTNYMALGYPDKKEMLHFCLDLGIDFVIHNI